MNRYSYFGGREYQMNSWFETACFICYGKKPDRYPDDHTEKAETMRAEEQKELERS